MTFGSIESEAVQQHNNYFEHIDDYQIPLNRDTWNPVHTARKGNNVRKIHAHRDYDSLIDGVEDGSM